MNDQNFVILSPDRKLFVAPARAGGTHPGYVHLLNAGVYTNDAARALAKPDEKVMLLFAALVESVGEYQPNTVYWEVTHRVGILGVLWEYLEKLNKKILDDIRGSLKGLVS